MTFFLVGALLIPGIFLVGYAWAEAFYRPFWQRTCAKAGLTGKECVAYRFSRALKYGAIGLVWITGAAFSLLR